ncbi:MAG: hypothetical protein IJ191_08010 [Treponema sp.]|nr:hypothetical protein [Treponema sp.]
MTEEKQKMSMGKKVLIGIGVYLLAGIIAVAVISQTDSFKNAETKQKTQSAAVESQKKVAPAMEATAPVKRNTKLSDFDRLRNPLIIMMTGEKRAIPNGMGQTIGYAQLIKVLESDLKTVTGRQLKDFWLECDFEGYMFVYIFEIDRTGHYTGNGMVVTTNGSYAKLGRINAYEKDFHFGYISHPAREFFYLTNENGFQYFNATDGDDEPLRTLEDSELPFVVD